VTWAEADPMTWAEALSACLCLGVGWVSGWIARSRSVPPPAHLAPAPKPPPEPIAFETEYKIGARVKCHLRKGGYFIGTIVDFESECDDCDCDDRKSAHAEVLPEGRPSTDDERLWAFKIGSPEIALIPPGPDPGYREPAKPDASSSESRPPASEPQP